MSEGTSTAKALSNTKSVFSTTSSGNPKSPSPVLRMASANTTKGYSSAGAASGVPESKNNDEEDLIDASSIGGSNDSNIGGSSIGSVGSNADSNSGSASGSSSNADSNSGSASSSGFNAESNSGSGSGFNAESNSGSGSNADSNSGSASGSNADSNSGSASGSASGSGSNADSNSGSASGSGIGGASNTGSNNGNFAAEPIPYYILAPEELEQQLEALLREDDQFNDLEDESVSQLKRRVEAGAASVVSNKSVVEEEVSAETLSKRVQRGKFMIPILLVSTPSKIKTIQSIDQFPTTGKRAVDVLAVNSAAIDQILVDLRGGKRYDDLVNHLFAIPPNYKGQIPFPSQRLFYQILNQLFFNAVVGQVDVPTFQTSFPEKFDALVAMLKDPSKVSAIQILGDPHSFYANLDDTDFSWWRNVADFNLYNTGEPVYFFEFTELIKLGAKGFAEFLHMEMSAKQLPLVTQETATGANDFGDNSASQTSSDTFQRKQLSLLRKAPKTSRQQSGSTRQIMSFEELLAEIRRRVGLPPVVQRGGSHEEEDVVIDLELEDGDEDEEDEEDEEEEEEEEDEEDTDSEEEDEEDEEEEEERAEDNKEKKSSHEEQVVIDFPF